MSIVLPENVIGCRETNMAGIMANRFTTINANITSQKSRMEIMIDAIKLSNKKDDR